MPIAIARALRSRGLDVVVPGEAGLLGAPDERHRLFALAEGRVIVTYDPDFLRMHHQQIPHAGIAFCGPGTRSIGQMVEALQIMAEVMQPEDMINWVEFL